MSRELKIKIIALTAAVLLFVALPLYFCLSYRKNGEFGDEIAKWADFFMVEEELIYAVIKAESGFDPYAVSPKGAMGLMQIMPDTADWIAVKLYKQDHSNEKLLDGAYNIEFGVWYLSYLYGKFGDRDTVIIAYNAGEGNAKKWLEGKIATLFAETRTYLRRVNRHYKLYKFFMF